MLKLPTQLRKSRMLLINLSTDLPRFLNCSWEAVVLSATTTTKPLGGKRS
jgi:hypothetical protein